MLSLSLLALVTLPVRAHFIWLLPQREGGGRLVFSDEPAPDDENLLKKVSHTKVFAVSADGKTTEVEFTQQKNALELKLEGKGARVLGAVYRYGVLRRGESEPFLLNYYAKTWLGGLDPRALEVAAKRLDLDIVPEEDFRSARVLWKGKPLPNAEVVLLPRGHKRTTIRTDKEGSCSLANASMGELYALRVLHTEAKEGVHDGKPYKEVRHYATLVFEVGRIKKAEKSSAVPRTTATQLVAARTEKKPEEDPQASKLLADARAARANWEQFPGFSANLQVNVEGNITRGNVDVDAKGKVTLTGIDDPGLEKETLRELRSVVSHRLDGSASLKTPCAFADDNVHHPLGRALRVLNDEFHSSYRVRDRQIIVVNRTMPDSRFTITVLENRRNEEKQFLPRSYVVNSWDLKTNALKSSQTFHQKWTRVGKFDLPSSILVVTASADGKLASRRLKLSHHKLKEAAQP
jgi:hypothetical protein